MTAEKSERNRIYRFLTLGVLLISTLMGSGCGLIDALRGGKKEQLSSVRAFFVREQDSQVRRDERLVRITGPVQQTARVVQEAIKQVTEAQSNVLRLQPNANEAYLGMVPIIRITTGIIKLDTLDAFKEYYHLGAYIMDDPEYKVQADNMGFTVEANMYVSGRDLLIRFTTVPFMDWNVYKRRGAAELDNWVRLPEKQKHRYGVGKYSFEREGTRYSRLGQPIGTSEIVTVTVDDQPRSKGIIEDILIDKLVELVAVTDMSASIVRR